MPIGTKHDASKFMLGAAGANASDMTVQSVPGDIAAGLAVRQNTTTGAYQVAASGAGPIQGISVGRSLGGAGTFSLCFASPVVAIQLGTGHTPTIGAQVNIDDSNGKTKASGGGATPINAVYKKLVTGISEVDGSSIACAIIEMAGGA